MKRLTIGEGRTALHYEIHHRGNDIFIHIDGGVSHLGSISIAEGNFLQTLSFAGHEEKHLTEPLAKKLASIFPCHVVVSGGVHLEQISREEIAQILQQNETAALKLISVLQKKE